MRRSLIAVALGLSVLLTGLMTPAASARAVHAGFHGLYFPAGLPGTGTTCPYTWVDPSFCVIDAGTWTELADGRIRIRDLELFELAFAWQADGSVEPRKTGYDVVSANANLDTSLSGPAWGTWMLYDFADELMFSGTFTAMFENGIPTVHFVGRGTGPYEGQVMRGDISREPDPYNMLGEVLEPGSLSR